MLRSMLHFLLPNDLPILNRLPFLVMENETMLLKTLFWECLGGNFDFCFLPFFVLAGKIEKLG